MISTENLYLSLLFRRGLGGGSGGLRMRGKGTGETRPALALALYSEGGRAKSLGWPGAFASVERPAMGTEGLAARARTVLL